MKEEGIVNDELIQPKEAMEIAKECGVVCSTPTIYRLLQDAGAHKVGGRWYIGESVWRRFLSGTKKG